MTEDEARRELTALLVRLGVQQGDTVYLGIDMSGLPLPSYPAKLSREAFRERENLWCDFVLTTILDYLGPRGTLVSPAFSYSCAAPGSTFTLETTPSEVGRFSERMRIHTNAKRTCHPIFSLSVIGAGALKITTGLGRAAFGALSAYARLAEMNTRFVCLGTKLRFSVTYLHHLEQTFGSNHRFNKIFHTEVRHGGQVIQGPWLAYMAYRCANFGPEFSSIERGLDKAGALVDFDWQGSPFQSATVSDITRVGYELLNENPASFISRRVEVRLNDTMCLAAEQDTVAEFDLLAPGHTDQPYEMETSHDN